MYSKIICSICIAVSLITTGKFVYGQRENDLQQKHMTALRLAEASVEKTNAVAERDSLRPIFHVTSASRFINDPNGPVYFAGEYHIFFQHLPFWGDSVHNIPVWGHAVSPDMVHWRHLPIALAPTPGTYDSEAIASGSCVISEGVPTIIYTGVGPQSQCLATSRDSLRTWIKDPDNPVITAPPDLKGMGDGFRDPFAWREGDSWRLLVGSSFQGQGGTVLLYQSSDLHKWKFLGPLCTGMGGRCIQWECPTFFPLGDKNVLIVSPLYRDEPGLRGMVEYAVGEYANNRFEPGTWHPIDLGGPTLYYAPNSFQDPEGRRILWGWIMAYRPPEAGWCNTLSIPRIVTRGPDGTLCFAPLPELSVLRYDKHVLQDFTLQPGREKTIALESGMHNEILLEVEMDKSAQVELRIGRSADGHHFIPLTYNDKTGRLKFGDKEVDFHLNPDEKILSIRLFIDGIVGEAYINGRACFSQVLPLSPSATGISVITTGGRSRIIEFTSWKMHSIWL
jgi:beta-fructofuranosidase